MSRKLSISFLGTGGYYPTTYLYEKGPNEVKYETPLVQIAMQSYLQGHHGFESADLHLLLLTDEAREQNYENANPPFGKETTTHKGLKAEIAAGEFLAKTVVQRVPSDHSREGIFKTFKVITEKVLEGDQIYIDITHGFRSLPMLAVVLANFLKVTKGAVVEKIYYGAFEDRTNYDGRAPVYDLSYLIDIQNWSTAAYSYTEYGFIEPLENLSTKETRPLLKESRGQHNQAKSIKALVTASKELALQLRTNRGNELFLGETATAIQNHFKEVQEMSDEFSAPLSELMEVVANKSQKLQNKGKCNWLIAARLASDDNLIQQTCSLLREGIVSYVCLENGLDQGKKTDRALVENILNAIGNNVSEDKWDVPTCYIEQYKEILNSSSVQAIYREFSSLSPFRNDLMHAGYYTAEGKDNARSAGAIIKKVRDILTQVESKLLL
jgi:CRISPR-associated Csx2 family protein